MPDGYSLLLLPETAAAVGPWLVPVVGLGVRVLFENSIVCRCTNLFFVLISVSARSIVCFLVALEILTKFSCACSFTLSGWVRVFFWMNARPRRFCWGLSFVFVCRFRAFYLKAFVESLILAQDERWRRA